MDHRYNMDDTVAVISIALGKDMFPWFNEHGMPVDRKRPRSAGISLPENKGSAPPYRTSFRMILRNLWETFFQEGVPAEFLVCRGVVVPAHGGKETVVNSGMCFQCLAPDGTFVQLLRGFRHAARRELA